jgi:hypothetical protein
MMGRPRAPRGIEDLDEGWLTEALKPWSDGARVVEVVRERIGLGNVSDSVRLSISWDRPTSAPASLVAKVPSSLEASRVASKATRTYEKEASFYAELANTVDVYRPFCYAARHEPDTDAYVVLLEDLHPAEPGDQLTGCRPDDAAAVIPELAGLHAPRWGDRRLLDLTWLDHPTLDGAEQTAALLAMMWPGFLERYEARLDPGIVALCERLLEHGARYLGDRPEPWTVAHGDFRLDNLLFGLPRVAVLDWQTVRCGPALSDVAYFVGSALLPEDRAASERDLVRAYREAMGAAGVSLAWDDCWAQYVRYTFDGVVMGIVASMLVARSERGDELFCAMVNRHGRHALDLEADRLLGR